LCQAFFSCLDSSPVSLPSPGRYGTQAKIGPNSMVVSKSYPSKFDFSRGDWQRTNKPEDLAIFGIPDKFTFSL